MYQLRLPLLFIALVFAFNAGAIASVEEEVKLLHENIRAQDREEVEKYKGRKPYLDAKNAEGYTALQEAIRWGHDDMIKLLVELGADPNALDADGRNALHHAALSNEVAAARLLIQKGVVVEQRDPYDYTPLHLAARKGNERVVKILLDAGADINAKIDVGFTAVDLADQFPTLQDYLRGRGGKAGHNLP